MDEILANLHFQSYQDDGRVIMKEYVQWIYLDSDRILPSKPQCSHPNLGEVTSQL